MEKNGVALTLFRWFVEQLLLLLNNMRQRHKSAEKHVHSTGARCMMTTSQFTVD